MESYRSAVFARPDTLLGVCEALGQDFGFNPLFLRIGFAVPLIWFPVETVGAYLALGLIVLLSRLLLPSTPKGWWWQRRESAAATTPERAAAPTAAETNDEEVRVPIAA